MDQDIPHLLLNRTQYGLMVKNFPELYDEVLEYNSHYSIESDSVVVSLSDNYPSVTKNSEIPWRTESVEEPISEWFDVKPSQLCKGMGLIAKKTIPKDTVYFDLDKEPHLKINKKQYECISRRFPEFEAKIRHFGFYVEDHVVFLLSQSRFMNHSLFPTGKFVDNKLAITVRDVLEGEELFEDYTEYGNCPWLRLWDDLTY